MERVRLGKMENPVRGFLHGAGAVLSVVGLVVLILRTWGDPRRMWTMVVFGVSLVALYTTSSLYHSVPWRPRWKERWQRLDHSMIFVLVAGTFTPLAVNVLDGSWRVVMLAVVWGIGLVGIAQKILWPRLRQWFSVTLQTSMGWSALIPLGELMRRLGTAPIVLTLVGGAFYTAGMVMYATRRPRLSPRVFSYHELFHLFVLAGSIAHFFMVLLYVVPYRG